MSQRAAGPSIPPVKLPGGASGRSVLLAGLLLAGLVLAGLGLAAVALAASRPEGLGLMKMAADHGGEEASNEVSGSTEAGFTTRRQEMVDDQLRRRGIEDPAVLAAMGRVPRHRFVPAEVRAQAYGDHPLPIGWQQTISQPFVVALMAELLEARGDERVLEIGTGSGYHAAVLSQLVDRVYSIEIVEPLAPRAAETLAQVGYDNVEVRVGDGYLGWPEQAPFDAIILTAAPERVPERLLEQVAVGGRIVLPLGGKEQDLVVLTRSADGWQRREIIPVRFVPMTGRVAEEVEP